METRFTIKDFFLFLMLFAVLIMLGLTMHQVDRQWEKLRNLEESMQDQTRRLGDLRRSFVEFSDEEIRGSAFRRAWQISQTDDFADGDWLVRSLTTNLETITPLRSSDAAATEVQNYVLESLLARDPDTLDWVPLLAADLPEVSEDGLTLTFRMRREAQFSDRTPVTAHDVVFTFEFIMDANIAAQRQRAYYREIQSVEALDDHTVRFVFERPYFNAFSLAGGMAVLPRHYYRKFREPGQAEAFNRSTGHLLGSGPYRLRSAQGTWSPSEQFVVLTRNEDYWGPVMPPFERVVWRPITQKAAELAAFRNREIDLYVARPVEFARLQDDPMLAKQARFNTYMSPIVGYSYIGWNQRRSGSATHFADQRVRRALTYLTDVDRIIDTVFYGHAERAVSPFSPRSRQHDPSVEPHPYDPARARELLADAGYTPGRDGILTHPRHGRLAFKLTYYRESTESETMVLLLRDLFMQAGVLVEPDRMEWPVMIDMLRNRTFEAITLGWTSGIETDIFQMFHGSQVADNADNFISYRNPELDALIDQARATVDEDKRMPIWQRCERILHEDVPYTFLVRRKSLLLVDRRIENLEVTRMGLNLFTPIEWFASAPLQISRGF